MRRQLAKEKRKEGEKTTPVGVSVMRSQVSYQQAAQELAKDNDHRIKLLYIDTEQLASHANLEQDQQGVFGEQASAATNMFDTKRKKPR